VPLDGARGQEQLGADLRVGVTVHDEPGDLRLLRGELAGRLGAPLAYRLAGGQQLAPGSFGERRHADRVQAVVSGPQLDAGVDAAVLAAQPFAVQQVGAGQFGAELGAAEPVDRLAVQVLGGLSLA
jgi:hypothetical protein